MGTNNNNISDFFIYALNEEKNIFISINETKYNMLCILVNLIKNNTTVFNEIINSNIHFLKNVKKIEPNANNIMQMFHKSLRQTDIYQNGNIDMIFYHLLSIEYINSTFYKILDFWLNNNNDEVDINQLWSFRDFSFKEVYTEKEVIDLILKFTNSSNIKNIEDIEPKKLKKIIKSFLKK